MILKIDKFPKVAVFCLVVFPVIMSDVLVDISQFFNCKKAVQWV